ncbi:MAG: nuclease [Thermus sp.]
MWRLEPWDPDYALFGLPPLSEEVGSKGVPLEEPWAPVARKKLVWPSFYLVDGRERVDGLLFDGERRVLLVSLAVGAVHRDGQGMRLSEVRLWRVAVGADRTFSFGEGLEYQPLQAPQAADPLGLWREAQKERRRLESELAQALSQKALVLLDGPLYQVGQPYGQVLGYVKTLWARYLPDPYQGLLSQLRPEERTPLFRIPEAQASGRRPALLSWYLRLPLSPEGLFPPEAALLRVEMPLAELEKARGLADLSLDLFCALASSPAKDPRAPQNPAPVGALEALLGRYLGQREVIQRRILRTIGGGV